MCHQQQNQTQTLTSYLQIQRFSLLVGSSVGVGAIVRTYVLDKNIGQGVNNSASQKIVCDKIEEITKSVLSRSLEAMRVYVKVGESL